MKLRALEKSGHLLRSKVAEGPGQEVKGCKGTGEML